MSNVFPYLKGNIKDQHFWTSILPSLLKSVPFSATKMIATGPSWPSCFKVFLMLVWSVVVNEILPTDLTMLSKGCEFQTTFVSND